MYIVYLQYMYITVHRRKKEKEKEERKHEYTVHNNINTLTRKVTYGVIIRYSVFITTSKT